MKIVFNIFKNKFLLYVFNLVISLLIVVLSEDCHKESAFYVKNFLGFPVENKALLPCIYSGLIKVDDSNIHFVYMKSKFINQSDKNPVVIWINEPGSSMFKSLITEASAFRFKNDFELHYNVQNNLQSKCNILFVDYPGDSGLSKSKSLTEINNINNYFIQFLKNFELEINSNANILNFSKHEFFIMGHSYLIPYLAKAVEDDLDLSTRIKINKVGLINAVIDKRTEAESRNKLAEYLSILSPWDLNEFNQLNNNCSFDKANNKKTEECYKLDHFIKRLSGDLSLSDIRESVYHEEYITEGLDKLLNDNNVLKDLNVDSKIIIKSNDKYWMDYNPEVQRNLLKNYLEYSINNKEYAENNSFILFFDEKNFTKSKFHIYILTGIFNFEFITNEQLIDKLIPSLSRNTLGLWNVPFSMALSSNNYYTKEKSFITKGYLKQNEKYTFLIFKNAGKYIGEGDNTTFNYFITDFFLNSKYEIPCLEELPANDNNISNSSQNSSIENINKTETNKISNNSTKNIQYDYNISDIKLDNLNAKRGKGGCINFSYKCMLYNNCNGNGICDETTNGKCKCFDKFYGPTCTHKEQPLTSKTNIKISSSDTRVFTPSNSFEFLIKDNLLIEIDSNNSNVAVSLMSKKKSDTLFDYKLHTYHQKLVDDKVTFYINKSHIKDSVIVVTNNETNKEIEINFNIVRFETSNIKGFFVPGGSGFIIAIIIFSIGLALFIAVHLIYKDSDYLVYTKFDSKYNKDSIKSKIQLNDNFDKVFGYNK